MSFDEIFDLTAGVYFNFYNMRVPPWIVCVFPGVFLSSRVNGACPVTTDLVTRVNVRTTTTFPAYSNFGAITFLSEHIFFSCVKVRFC